jgi:hypothetical protein
MVQNVQVVQAVQAVFGFESFFDPIDGNEVSDGS